MLCTLGLPVCLQLPTWQLALPDKLLQFRPVDLLRADIFAVAGLIALLAQVRGRGPLALCCGSGGRGSTRRVPFGLL